MVILDFKIDEKELKECTEEELLIHKNSHESRESEERLEKMTKF